MSDVVNHATASLVRDLVSMGGIKNKRVIQLELPSCLYVYCKIYSAASVKRR